MATKVRSRSAKSVSRPSFLEILLVFSAVLQLVLAIGWLVLVFLLERIPPVGLRIAAGLAGSFLLVSLAACVWGLSDLMAGQRRLRARQKQLEGRLESLPPGDQPLAQEGPGVDAANLSGRFDELRRLLMMSQQQREQMHQREIEAMRDRLGGKIEQSIFASQWNLSEELLRQYRDKVGIDSQYERWSEQLEDRRIAAAQREKRHATQRVEALMAAGRFEEASQLVEELSHRMGEDEEIAQLQQRVGREHKAYQQDRVQRLYRQVQSQAKQRNWQQALKAAEELRSNYPDRPEARLVEVIQETLRENARLERVRQLRDEIRDMIGRQRYSQALELAREVVRDYPETAAAQELSQQMDRLAQRAAQEE